MHATRQLPTMMPPSLTLFLVFYLIILFSTGTGAPPAAGNFFGGAVPAPGPTWLPASLPGYRMGSSSGPPQPFGGAPASAAGTHAAAHGVLYGDGGIGAPAPSAFGGFGRRPGSFPQQTLWNGTRAGAVCPTTRPTTNSIFGAPTAPNGFGQPPPQAPTAFGQRMLLQQQQQQQQQSTFGSTSSGAPAPMGSDLFAGAPTASGAAPTDGT